MLFEQNTLPEGPYALAWQHLESHKSLTERVVDVVPIPWFLAESGFSGQYTCRKDYEAFDEVVCGLLLAQPGCDSPTLRAALGLDAELGDRVLNRMIEPLKGTMIDGDASYWYLTDRGRTYAGEGRKFVRNACKFALSLDLQDWQVREAQLIRKAVGEWKETGPEVNNADSIKASVEKQWENRDKLLDWVGVQVPSYHSPSKGMYLEEWGLKAIRILQATVLVGVLEDVQDHHLHYIAFHAQDGKEIAAITQVLNAPDKEKARERVQAAIRKRNADSIVAEAHVPEPQQQDEAWIREKSLSLQSLPKEEKGKAAAAILNERKSFDTVEFEQELERLSQQGSGEWWLISPWIRSAAWAKRKRQVERALGRGVVVFLGYSQPHVAGEEMVPADVLRDIKALQDRHPKLFVGQLPQFHEKIMYAEVQGQRYEYTGSFNLLSFAAGNQERIGRENMRRLQWGEDSTANRDKHLHWFRQYYAAKWDASFKALEGADLTERKDILTADRALKEIVQQFEPFVDHCGGELAEGFRQRCTQLRHRQATALHEWQRRQLRVQTDELKTLRPMSKAEADRHLRSALDRLKTDSIPESAFATEIKVLRQGLEQLAIPYEFDQWTRELNGLPGTLTEGDRKRYQERLDRLRSSFPHADPQLLDEAYQGGQQLLKEKQPEVGLKVVGKIDLPPENHGGKKKKKNKR